MTIMSPLTTFAGPISISQDGGGAILFFATLLLVLPVHLVLIIVFLLLRNKVCIDKIVFILYGLSVPVAIASAGLIAVTGSEVENNTTVVADMFQYIYILSMLAAPASFIGLVLNAVKHKKSTPISNDPAQEYINSLPPAETLGKEQESPHPETVQTEPTNLQPINNNEQKSQ